MKESNHYRWVVPLLRCRDKMSLVVEVIVVMAVVVVVAVLIILMHKLMVVQPCE